MRRLLTRICSGLVLIAFLFTAAQAQVQLGNLTFGASRSTVPLRADVSFAPGEMTAALRSLAFLEQIGGVAFGAIATPQDVAVRSLALSYNQGAGDGKRVEVTINDATYVLPVHDWILAPAIQIASTEDIALATAFGEYAGSKATDSERCDHFVFSLQAALRDNLLGLRVLQADLIGIHPDQYPDLPRVHGAYLLGPGEKAPTPEQLAAGQKNQEAVFGNVKAYSSYIFADEHVSFSLHGHAISFAGDPVYHFWRSKLDDKDQEQWMSEYIAAAEKAHWNRQTLLRHGVDAANKLIAALADNRRRMTDPERRETLEINILWLKGEPKRLESASDSELKERVAGLEWRRLGDQVDMLSTDHNPLRNPAAIEASNPTIYAAMKTLSHTLAFLRYVRRNFPAAWRDFSSATQAVKSIAVEVPTDIPRGGREMCQSSDDLP